MIKQRDYNHIVYEPMFLGNVFDERACLYYRIIAKTVEMEVRYWGLLFKKDKMIIVLVGSVLFLLVE